MATKYRARIGIDARMLLRPLRGIGVYVWNICQLVPQLMDDCLFYLFINRGFQHNDKSTVYESRLLQLSHFPNIRIININHEAEIIWEQIYLPILCHRFNLSAIHLPANTISFISNFPTVSTVHDAMSYIFMEQLIPYPSNTTMRLKLYILRQRLYIYLLYKHGFRRADHLITVSSHSAHDIETHLSIPRDKITVIHHGVDMDFSFIEGEPLPLENRDLTLMLGGDSFQKNPTGAIAAWSIVPKALRDRFPLTIVGFTGTSDSPLVQAIIDHNLQDEITVFGMVPKATLIEFYRRAALFLFLSRYEGFGFPILEAMASGTPVVHSSTSSLSEIAGGAGIPCNPDDHPSIARSISHLLISKDEWIIRQHQGLLRSQKFNWDTSARKHISIYNSLLEH